MFNAKVVSFLAALSLMAADVVQASGWNQQHYTSCDNFPCGPHYVCQMVEPNVHCPHASCAFPQCVPPTSCDDLDCPAGYVCEVDDPPSNCPHCQPRAVCKPENQGYCENGQAYNYQIGQCVPYTCESPDACPDSTCTPANPGIVYCNHKYTTTGVPCEFFTCDDYNPCAAKTCLVGSVCEVVNGVAECVCDTPTYVFNDFVQACVPNSCNAVGACPQGTTCVPGGDPNCQGNCRPYTCEGTPNCPYGKVYDEYSKQCVPDPCDDTTCGVGEKCILTRSGAIATDCVCDEPLYVYSHQENKCVPNSCDAPGACPGGTTCVPGANPHCNYAHCPPYTCQPTNPDCDDGYEYDTYQKKCVAVSCAADPCPAGLTCVDDDDLVCVTTPCFRFTCKSCSAGYEYDLSKDKCVPVSCQAPNACPVNKECVDDDTIQCVTSPCKQYTCEHPSTDPCDFVQCGYGTQCDAGYCCPVGTAWDPSKYRCVPVSCQSPYACPYHKVCVDDDSITCDTTPCKKYTCELDDGPTDPCAAVTCGPGSVCDGGNCVPVSCEAPNACPTGKYCVDDDSIQCVTSPCQQFTCEDSAPADPCDGYDCADGLVCKPYADYYGTLQPYCVCPDNYEWHPGYHKCVPKNCDATDPCPGNKSCIPYDRHCYHAGPCPQYYCQ